MLSRDMDNFEEDTSLSKDVKTLTDAVLSVGDNAEEAFRQLSNTIMLNDPQLRNGVVLEIAGRLKKQHERRLGRKKTVCAWAISSEQEKEMLRKCFPETEIIFSGTKYHVHGLAAFERQLEENLLLKEFGNLNQRPPVGYDVRVIDVGGNFLRHFDEKRKIHSCCPVLDAKDNARNSAREHKFASRVMDEEAREFMNNFPSQYLYCHNRAEECDYTAPFLMFVHSSYDMGNDEFYSILKKKNASVVHGVVAFDPRMFFKDKGEMGYGMNYRKFDRNGVRMIEFSFPNGDMSESYVHQWEKYSFIVSHSVVRNPEGAVEFFIEKKWRENGSLFFSIHRALFNAPESSIKIRCTLPGGMSLKTLMVYDYDVEMLGVTEKLVFKRKTVVLPSDLWDRAFSHIMTKTDGSFTIQSCIQSLATFNQRIIVNGQDVVVPESVPAEEIPYIATMLYFMVYKTRFRQGQVLKKLIEDENNVRAGSVSFLQRLKNFFSRDIDLKDKTFGEYLDSCCVFRRWYLKWLFFSGFKSEFQTKIEDLVQVLDFEEYVEKYGLPGSAVQDVYELDVEDDVVFNTKRLFARNLESEVYYSAVCCEPEKNLVPIANGGMGDCLYLALAQGVNKKILPVSLRRRLLKSDHFSKLSHAQQIEAENELRSNEYGSDLSARLFAHEFGVNVCIHLEDTGGCTFIDTENVETVHLRLKNYHFECLVQQHVNPMATSQEFGIGDATENLQRLMITFDQLVEDRDDAIRRSMFVDIGKTPFKRTMPNEVYCFYEAMTVAAVTSRMRVLVISERKEIISALHHGWPNLFVLSSELATSVPNLYVSEFEDPSVLVEAVESGPFNIVVFDSSKIERQVLSKYLSAVLHPECVFLARYSTKADGMEAVVEFASQNLHCQRLNLVTKKKILDCYYFIGNRCRNANTTAEMIVEELNRARLIEMRELMLAVRNSAHDRNASIDVQCRYYATYFAAIDKLPGAGSLVSRLTGKNRDLILEECIAHIDTKIPPYPIPWELVDPMESVAPVEIMSVPERPSRKEKKPVFCDAPEGPSETTDDTPHLTIQNPDFDPKTYRGAGVQSFLMNATAELVESWRLHDSVVNRKYHRAVSDLNEKISSRAWFKKCLDLILTQHKKIVVLFGNKVVASNTVFEHAYAYYRDGVKPVNSGVGYGIASDMTKLYLEPRLYELYGAVELKNLVVPKLEFIQGVPGCGKTHEIITTANAETDLIVTSTRANKESMKEALNGAEWNEKVKTVFGYLINPVVFGRQRILLDEIFMSHPGVLLLLAKVSGADCVRCYGDVLQIPYINRNDLIPLCHLDLSRHVSLNENRGLSYRCPKDVVRKFAREYSEIGVRFETKSTVESSLHWVVVRSLAEIPIELGVHYMTAMQSDKNELLTRGFPGVKTITETQGQTKKKVVMIRISTKTTDEIYRDPNQVLVALTRHTESFVYYTLCAFKAQDDGIVAKITSTRGGGIMRNLFYSTEYNESRIRMHGVSRRLYRKLVLTSAQGRVNSSHVGTRVNHYGIFHLIRNSRESVYLDFTNLTNVGLMYADVEHLFKYFSKTKLAYFGPEACRVKDAKIRFLDKYEDANGINFGVSSEIVGEKLPEVLTPDSLSSMSVELTIGDIQEIYDYWMNGKGHVDQSLDSWIIRHEPMAFNIDNIKFNPIKLVVKDQVYGFMTPNLKTTISMPRDDNWHESVLALLKRNKNVPELMADLDEVHLAELMFARFKTTFLCGDVEYREINHGRDEAMEWLSTQGYTSYAKVEMDAITLRLKSLNAYDFMIKRNAKPKLDDSAVCEYQSLQTICYQGLPLNTFFCPIFSMMRKRLTSLLKTKYVMNVDMNNDELENALNCMCLPKIFKKIEMDMRKYDKAQGRALLLFETMVFRYLGLSDEMSKMWMLMHERTKLFDRKNAIATRVDYQRKSGDAATFFGNTIVLMGVMACLYSDAEMLGAVFAGDDSVIFTSGVLKSRNKLCSDTFGLECKVLEHQYTMFCSRFLLRKDMLWYVMPDPLKIITKLGRHDLRNEEHVSEYYIAYADLMHSLNRCELWPWLIAAFWDRYNKVLPMSLLEGMITLSTSESVFLNLYSYTSHLPKLEKAGKLQDL